MRLDHFSPKSPLTYTSLQLSDYIKWKHGNYEKDTFYLFGGVGDPVLWLSLLYKYREISQKKITLVCPEGSEAIPLLYKGRSFDILKSQKEFVDLNSFFSGTFKLKKNEGFAHHMYYGDEQVQNYTQPSVWSGLSNIDMIKSILGLPLDTLPIRPLPSAQSMLEAAKLFLGLNLNVGKTIFIAPHANSYPHKLPDSWWKGAVKNLRDEGYLVVHNAITRPHFSEGGPLTLSPIDGALSVELPISMVIPFVELCGNFIGIRSGLCDLVAHANAKKLIMYPEPKPIADNYEWVRSVAHYWALNRNYRSDATREYLVGDEGLFYSAITDYFKD